MRTMRGLSCHALVGVTVLALVPGVAFAQGSITGVVRDTSGAVLPGVTVEAASPVPIEKIRTVVSDGGGQYRIVDLRPGVYDVTFTLTGFNTVRREALELVGNFTATINAEMRVGAIEETITVTGEAPVVDVQGMTRQRVMTDETMEAIPSGRNYSNLGVLIPGVSTQCAITCASGSQDVGGSSGDARTNLTVHGSRFRDQKLSVNGLTMQGSAGGLVVHGPNLEAMQEVQLDTSGIDASVSSGGVRINLVPKDGGNSLSGSLFTSYTNEHLQSDNFTQELEDRGLLGTSRIKTLYDVAPDIWRSDQTRPVVVFGSARFSNSVNYVANLFENANAGDPAAWVYVPDRSRQVTSTVRFTRSGFGSRGKPHRATRSQRPSISGTLARVRTSRPGRRLSKRPMISLSILQKIGTFFTWTSPVTNRLLLQGTVAYLPDAWYNKPGTAVNPSLVQVVEQNPQPGHPSTYRGGGSTTLADDPFADVAFIATYVTGAHEFKAGATNNWGYVRTRVTTPRVITSYTFNRGTPTQFTINSDPRTTHLRVPREVGLFVQDKWTINRLTVNGGVRYDYIKKVAPELTLGPAPTLPNRNITFPETVILAVHDLSPRLGLAYDLFGTGKTAVKTTLNRYVTDESLGGGANRNGAPFNYFQYTAARAWTDGNQNFVPDCDYSNGAAQDNRADGGDFCGAFTGASANFGRTFGGTVDDKDVAFGWGHRGYNWEFSASVQQEIVPGRVSVDFGYFRRWFGNFTVTDNLAVAASDYDSFSVNVPNNDRLPLSGKSIEGFLNIDPSVASLPSNNHVRLSNQYGKQYQNWQGVDFGVSARIAGGTMVQGGLSTGRTVADNCEILAKVPEGGVTAQQGVTNGLLPIAGSVAVPFCHQQTPYLTQFKLLGTYTIPRIDVQLSGTFQTIPGPQISANLVVLNADIAPSLGRNLAGNAANVTVPIIAPGTLYGDRLHQIDLRVGKLVPVWRNSSDDGKRRPVQRSELECSVGREHKLLFLWNADQGRRCADAEILAGGQLLRCRDVMFQRIAASIVLFAFSHVMRVRKGCSICWIKKRSLNWSRRAAVFSKDRCLIATGRSGCSR